MNTYLFYLRHEWRQNRAALAFCALFSGGLALWATTFMDAYAVSQSSVAVFGMLQAALLYLFAVGSGLLAANEHNAPRFFERLPRALAASFSAKLSFFFLGLLAALAFGFGSLWLASTWRVGEAPLSPLEVPNFALSTSFFVAWAGWTFVASAWVPRAAFALPIGLVQLSVFAFPYAVIGPWFKIEPIPTMLFMTSMALASLPAALVTFRNARGTDSRVWKGVLSAFAVGAVFAAPSWAFLACSRHTPATIGVKTLRSIGPVTFSEDGSQVLAMIDTGRLWQHGADYQVYTLNVDEGVFENPVANDGWSARRRLLPKDASLRSKWGSGTLYYWLEDGDSREAQYVDPRRNIERGHSQVFGELVLQPGYHRLWVGETWVFWLEHERAFWSYDPKLETREPLPWTGPSERGVNPTGQMLSDGRFLFAWGEDLFVGDPRTGERNRIAVPPGDGHVSVRFLYSQLVEELGEQQPVLVLHSGGYDLFDGEKLVPGPCIEGHPGAHIYDYRVTETARQFLWVDTSPPHPVNRFQTTEIWISDVDTNDARRLFPPHDWGAEETQ